MECSEAELRSELVALGNKLNLEIRVRFPSSGDQQSIAALVTKESHCLRALIEAAESDDISANVDVIIGNHSTLQPLATQHGIPFYDIGDEKGTPDEDQLIEILDEYDIDLIALARYIRILSPEVVFRYPSRIINVHPSLLPAFTGASAYMQAIEEGVRITGVTAHYVTPDLDQGPIIAQRAFNVPQGATEDDLREIGQPLEADALLEAVRLHLNNNIVSGRGRTEVRDPDAQVGMPEEITAANPNEPVDKGVIGMLTRSRGASD